MSINHKNLNKLITILFIIISLIVPNYSGIGHAEDVGVCERALAECLLEAFIIGIFAGPEGGVGYTLWCGAGYQWCKLYYEY